MEFTHAAGSQRMDLLDNDGQTRENPERTHTTIAGRNPGRKEKTLLLAWMSTLKSKSSKMV